MKHIPTRFFNSSIIFEKRMKVIFEYESEKWDQAKFQLSEKRKISLNAIKITSKLKEAGIFLFPLVHTIAVKGYSSDGQVIFRMYGENGHIYNFYDSAQKISNKRTNLEIVDGTFETEIHIK